MRVGTVYGNQLYGATSSEILVLRVIIFHHWEFYLMSIFDESCCSSIHYELMSMVKNSQHTFHILPICKHINTILKAKILKSVNPMLSVVE